MNPTDSVCHKLYWVLVSKQSKTNFALLAMEANHSKGEAALFVSTEAQNTLLFCCLFSLRSCSK